MNISILVSVLGVNQPHTICTTTGGTAETPKMVGSLCRNA